MEAPLRRLAEGYHFFPYGFPSVPGLLYRLGNALPNQPPTPALPGSRLWGVSYISICIKKRCCYATVVWPRAPCLDDIYSCSLGI
ncbi:hypothetical protein GGR53DRAFT_475778 [Hypoxylon sp. FL1150]|nr:hypothetical protein GGR53DRAFT_475778 [Hypoxylon sp. FL1150]